MFKINFLFFFLGLTSGLLVMSVYRGPVFTAGFFLSAKEQEVLTSFRELEKDRREKAAIEQKSEQNKEEVVPPVVVPNPVPTAEQGSP